MPKVTKASPLTLKDRGGCSAPEGVSLAPFCLPSCSALGRAGSQEQPLSPWLGGPGWAEGHRAMQHERGLGWGCQGCQSDKYFIMST